MQSSVSSPVLGAGEVLWDLLPSGPRLGGATTNFAILSARLGDYVALVSRVGCDAFGERALRELQTVAAGAQTQGHFDLGGMQTSESLPTGTVTVTLEGDGKPNYRIDGPVAWDEMVVNDRMLELAGSASAIYFGTLSQREPTSRETIRRLVRSTSPACVRICDINLRLPFCSDETLRWCLEHATVLKVSDEELPAVSRMLALGVAEPATSEVERDDELTEWARRSACALLALAPGCSMVATTLGSRGSLLVNRSGADRHGGFAVEVSDTVGAGDAFTAGLLHALVRGATLEQMNLVSNLCGSYVASQPGATPELPEALLARIRLTLQPQGL